jgi:hypothetical protein
MYSDLRNQRAREKMRQAEAAVKAYLQNNRWDPKEYADLLNAAREAREEYLSLVEVVPEGKG